MNDVIDQAMKEVEEAEEILNSVETDETQWTKEEREKFRNMK